MKVNPQSDAGFTIIELLIVMLISSVVMIGIWNTFHFQQQSYALQRQLIAMHQNLRSAMLFMETELRMAGYDPSGAANAGVAEATGSHIRFTMDIDSDSGTDVYDGDITDPNEDVTYELYTEDGISKLGRRSPAGTSFRPVAEHITALAFTYLDGNGDTIASPSSNLASIRTIQISLTAATANTNPTRTATLQTRINCRNLGLGS